MGHEHYDPDAEAESGWQATIGGIEVRFGCGALDALGDAAVGLGGSRALVVTDPGLVAAGHAAAAVTALESSGVRTVVFDGAVENPTTRDVEAAADAARSHHADLLVGLGGGSSMDCAKGANFLFVGGGSMEEYWGYGKARGRLLPSIGVPTTAGTGSDAQSFALVSRAEDHVKMACGDPQARFKVVLLDPCLLASLPRSVAALAATDAVSHAVESYVTKRRNPASRILAGDAWHRLDRSFEPFLLDRGNLAASTDMLIGAHFAGGAIEASMLGAAHACANPLTARFGTTHGVAVGVMLPHVVRFNAGADGIEELYEELLGGGPQELGVSASESLARRLTRHGEIAGLPRGLEALGIDPAVLDQLSAEAATQWTGTFNPRPVDARAAHELYRAAYAPDISETVPAASNESTLRGPTAAIVSSKAV